MSGLLIMGAGGGSLVVLSMLLLRRKKPYGAISHGVVEVSDVKMCYGEAFQRLGMEGPDAPLSLPCPYCRWTPC